MTRTATVAVLLAVCLALAACDYNLTPTDAESLVGKWEARNFGGDVIYIADLAADGTYTLTKPGEPDPYQSGAWSYQRDDRTLTLAGSTIPVSSETPNLLCVVPHQRGGDCMVTWRRM